MKLLLVIWILLAGCEFRSARVGPELLGLSPVDQGAVDNQEAVDLPEAPLIAPEPTPPLVNEIEEPMLGGDPINDLISYFIEGTVFDLAHDSAVRWDGCEIVQRVPGGYNSDSKCGKAFLHPDFAHQLNEYFFPCVVDAAQVAGLPRPDKVFMHHVGTYNDRNARGSSSLSMHAYARAMDITNFNLYDVAGNLTRISTHINNYAGTTAKFYDEFRQCWQESLPDSCGPGDREYQGSIGHTKSALGGNSLHADHIHLSYPTCGQIVVAAAELEDDSLAEDHVLLAEEVENVQVIVRNDGHLLGKPFAIELRPRCGQQLKAINDLPVADMLSACAVDLQSLASSDGQLSIDIYDAESPEHCSQQKQTVVFDLKKYCK